MTFDDGPHPVLTPRLLDMLKARGIRATFFLISQNAAEYPDIVRRISAEGHEIGNHTWNHDIHATTVAAMPDVFDSLLANGYKFATVSELIAMDKPAPQVAHKEPSASPTPR